MKTKSPRLPRRSPAEKWAATFSNLGRRLSAARTQPEAARILMDTADELFGWDACTFTLCSPDQKASSTVLYIDTIKGKRVDVSAQCVDTRLSPYTRQAMEHGAQLILRPEPIVMATSAIPFGDKRRPSASLMFAPLRKEAKVIGVLSIQSYRPNAYTEDALEALQALADHCGGALERIRAEAELNESNERLRLALAASKMGTWSRELNGSDHLRWSPELERIFGLHPGEFRGTEQAFLDLVHADDREPVRQAIARAIETRSDCEVEFRFSARPGAPGWMLARGRVYSDASGKPIRLAGVGIDITEQKQAQQEIVRLNTDLERRVRERTAQLEAINKELEAFCYSVSHDLRAPLRSIRGFSEVLLERYAAKLDAKGQEFLRRACQSSLHMDKLIEDLLKLSRVTRADLQRQPVNLSALAESIAAELQKAGAERRAEFVIAPNLEAHGDERLLRVVLDNLLRNAWKFTGKQPKPRIEFGLADEPSPAFFVRDNGAGFDVGYANRLFGVFQRLHSASEFPGTGVGLATVQRIINRHGGKVWATGAVHQGATFYFTLPDNGDI